MHVADCVARARKRVAYGLPTRQRPEGIGIGLRGPELAMVAGKHYLGLEREHAVDGLRRREGVAQVLAAQREEIGEPVRAERVASEDDLALRQPHADRVRTLGAVEPDHLEPHAAQSERVGVVDHNVGFDKVRLDHRDIPEALRLSRCCPARSPAPRHVRPQHGGAPAAVTSEAAMFEVAQAKEATGDHGDAVGDPERCAADVIGMGVRQDQVLHGQVAHAEQQLAHPCRTCEQSRIDHHGAVGCVDAEGGPVASGDVDAGQHLAERDRTPLSEHGWNAAGFLGRDGDAYAADLTGVAAPGQPQADEGDQDQAGRAADADEGLAHVPRNQPAG